MIEKGTLYLGAFVWARIEAARRGDMTEPHRLRVVQRPEHLIGLNPKHWRVIASLAWCERDTQMRHAYYEAGTAGFEIETVRRES